MATNEKTRTTVKDGRENNSGTKGVGTRSSTGRRNSSTRSTTRTNSSVQDGRENNSGTKGVGTRSSTGRRNSSTRSTTRTNSSVQDGRRNNTGTRGTGTRSTTTRNNYSTKSTNSRSSFQNFKNSIKKTIEAVENFVTRHRDDVRHYTIKVEKLGEKLASLNAQLSSGESVEGKLALQNEKLKRNEAKLSAATKEKNSQQIKSKMNSVVTELRKEFQRISQDQGLTNNVAREAKQLENSISVQTTGRPRVDNRRAGTTLIRSNASLSNSNRRTRSKPAEPVAPPKPPRKNRATLSDKPIGSKPGPKPQIPPKPRIKPPVPPKPNLGEGGIFGTTSHRDAQGNVRSGNTTRRVVTTRSSQNSEDSGRKAVDNSVFYTENSSTTGQRQQGRPQTWLDTARAIGKKILGYGAGNKTSRTNPRGKKPGEKSR